jgi:hypothetical protein
MGVLEKNWNELSIMLNESVPCDIDISNFEIFLSWLIYGDSVHNLTVHEWIYYEGIEKYNKQVSICKKFIERQPDYMQVLDDQTIPFCNAFTY